MKWIRRVVVVIAILLGGLVGIAYLTALRTEHPVGFEVVRASVAGGRPVAVGVWYPTEARPGLRRCWVHCCWTWRPTARCQEGACHSW